MVIDSDEPISQPAYKVHNLEPTCAAQPNSEIASEVTLPEPTSVIEQVNSLSDIPSSSITNNLDPRDSLTPINFSIFTLTLSKPPPCWSNDGYNDNLDGFNSFSPKKFLQKLGFKILLKVID